MENSRKNIYITIFVITTVLASCFAVYFAIEASNNAPQNITTGKVESVATDDVKTSETKVEIKEIEKEISQENIDKIARVTIDDYLNLTAQISYTDNAALVSYYLGFYNSYQDFEQHTTFLSAQNKYKTDIKFNEFLSKIQKYMTKELFEEKYLNKVYENIDGNVVVRAGGASGYTQYVTDVQFISKNNDVYEYKAKYNIYAYGETLAESGIEVAFKMKKVNDSFVISECSK